MSISLKLREDFFPDEHRVHLVAIDPGATIGLAKVVLVRNQDCAWEATFSVGELPWPDGARGLQILLENSDLVILERFTPYKTAAKKGFGAPQEVIGHIKGLLWAVGFQSRLVMRSPAAKEIAPKREELQERLGLRIVGEHRLDALRHLLSYLMLKRG